MAKRILSCSALFLAVCLVFLIIPCSVLAATDLSRDPDKPRITEEEKTEIIEDNEVPLAGPTEPEKALNTFPSMLLITFCALMMIVLAYRVLTAWRKEQLEKSSE